VQVITVTWRNVDAATHQVVGDDGGFASLALKTGDTYSATFDKAGTFKYRDTETKFRGTISVTATPLPVGSVTLATQRQSVVYGSSVTLTGTVSNSQSGEPVVLLAQEAGQPKLVQTAQVDTTGPGGAFSFAVSPTIRTAYQVQWKTASSHMVAIYVAPRVVLHVNSHGVFSTQATSDLSYSGHYVLFQRLNRAGGWYTIRRVVLGSRSYAAFRARLPHGTSRVRIWMTASQAGFGYLAGNSATLVVHR